MARVISWRIDNKFVYIEDRNQHPQCIYDAQWDNERIRQHGRTVLGWSESVYEANFNYMYGKVSEQWGTATDLRSDYRFYYNATEEDGVYMLSGIDGANIADYGKPFYNLVIENANTSLGLGGDYTLDVDATVKTWIYLERNGTVYLPDEVSVKYGSETVVSRTYNEPGRTRVEIDIPRGTMFTNNERNREYEITAKKNGFEGRVMFTVVGVKDGEEGMSYDLLVHPKQIKVSSDGEISNYSVTCKILQNGVEVPQESGRFEIRYTFGIPTTDYDDVGNVYSGPISYNTLSENGDQVNFYLYVNGRIVDTDSCIVSRDGIDGGFMKLELDNEIDAVGVGSDSKLDVTGGVRFSTGMILYSAGTELTITRVVVDDGNGDQALPCVDSTGKAHYSVEGLNRKYATFHTLLDNGYEFGIDLRNSVKITAYGTNEVGEQGYASANYILLGIQGAEDGVTYKLMPSADYILYDPNTRLVKWGTHEAVSVDDIANESLVIYPLENGRQKGGGEIIADNEFLSYSVGVTYSSAGSAVAPILNGEQPQNGTTFRLSELFNEEVTAENATSKFVTFYWCKQVSGNFVMIDRETVPVIIQGINGNSIWVELGNEIDAVGVGNDTDLDIEEDVTLGTTVRIISGGTPIRIESIEVIKPRGTESNWDDYAESTTGFTGSDHATPDNGTHTIGYVSITLKNGFEFGPDYREAPTIKATAVQEDGGWSGFTQYIIKGIANGKDGYVYRLMPEVDYVTFNPNAGHDGTLDENEVSCRAYYGKYELGEEGFTNGTIYYSVNCIYDSIPDVIPDTSMSGAYVTGFTEYTSSVSLDEILSKENYWNFKYIVFYLVVDTDMPDGTVFRELVDRETVKIISDGLDAQGNATIELTNEIDSIGLGGDTILDLPAGETRRLSTGVRVFSGGTRLSIYELTGAFQAGSNAPSGTYSFGRIPPATEDDDDVFYVDIKNGFNFGKDYKEKVIITAKARNENNEVATVSAIFVLAGIKSGKDGQTYKVQPTPDYAFYDLQLGRFVGDNNISAWAYGNGKLLSGSSTYNTDYQIKYTNNVLYDLETAEQNWGSTVFKAYQPEGNNLHFDTPSGSLDREQAKVFYLAVSSDSGAHWTVVDRESVPLFINGKEGKDGVGAARFDNTNPFVVINTGDDLKLDTTTGYTTVIYGYEGVTKVPIDMAGPVPSQEGNSSSYCRVTTGYTDDNLGIKFTINFKNWTFPDSQKITKSLAVKFRNDRSIQGSVSFTIIAVMNGKGAEGDAYKLRTNVSRIISDGAEFSPTTIRTGLYLGQSTVTGCRFYFRYLTEDQVTDLSNRGTLPDILTSVSFYTSYDYYSGGTNPSSANIASQIHAQHENGVVYISVFQDGVFLDSEDIPVQVDIDGGSSSGIIADLTDDVGVIAAGDDHKLSGVTKTLTTKAFVRSGNGGYLPITSCATIPTYTDPNGNGTVRIVPHTIPSGGVNYLEFDVNINTENGKYIDFHNNNPLQFDIDITAVTSDNTEVGVKVAYSLLGLKAGVDGQTVLLELNSDQIFYDPTLTGQYRFSPQTVQARLFINGSQYTHQNDGIIFDIKNSDMSDESATEMWLGIGSEKTVDGKTYWEFPINDDDITEYEPLTVVAMSGDTLLDWETVQIYRNGVDGEGGLKLFVEPSEIPVPVSDGHPSSLFTAQAILELHSGTTLDTMSSVSFRTSYPRTGSTIDTTHDIAITYATHPTDQKLKVVNITASTAADLSEPIEIEISATSNSDGQTRRAILTLKPESGGKGERGPKTRIRDWSDETALDYQNGSDDDEFWDIVYYHNDDFGGYFGCKQDQSVGTSKRAPSVVDGAGQSDDYWEYYPDYDFVATKVMSIGEWPNGWVIDKGKIQHTNSSITLTSNGEVTVSVPSTKYLAYSNSSDGIVYLDGAEKYSNGEKVIAYRLHTGTAQSGDIKIDNNRYLRVDDSKNYVYESGNIKVDKSVVNIGCYISCEKDLLDAMESMDPVVYLTSPSTLSDPFFARIRISGNSYTYIYQFEPNSKIGSYVSKTPLVLSSPLRLGRQYATEELYPPGYDEDLPGGDISEDPVFPVNPDLPPLEPDLPTYTKRTITAFNLCETEDGVGKTYIQETKNSVVNRVYTRQYGSSLYFKFDSSVSFGTTATAASDIYSRSTSNDEEVDTNKVSLKIQSVDYEHVNDTPILTVGYPEGDRIYSWKSGNKTIYTKVPYATDYAYNIDGEPLDDVKAVDGNQIMYDGEYYEYYSDVVLSSSQKDKFAFTKIYGDGRVVTDKLVAFGGEFKGNVKATNGIFNGEVNATHGTLTGVTIVNAANIGGNISMSGNNKFSMTDATGVQRILFSNTDIEPGQYVGGSSAINLGFHEEYHDYMKSATLWTTFSNTWTKKVFDIFLYAGDKIGGMIAITFNLTDCHESASEIWVYGELQKGAQFGGHINYTASNVPNGSRTIYVHIGKTSNMADTTNSTSENSITIGTGSAGPGQYTLELRVGGKFRKNTWGNTAYFDVGITSEIKVERGTGTGGGTTDQVNKFVVGPNGIAHVTREGGVFSSVSNASGSTSLSMFSDTNTSGVHQNGIYIDKNEFKMVHDGSVYTAVVRTMQYRTTNGTYAEGRFLMFIPS
jgi:hypothetical protein